MPDRILEITFTAIVIYLVLSNASSFSNVITSTAAAYTSGVRALQGR